MSGHLTEDISDFKCHMRSYRLNQIEWVLTDSSHYTKIKLQSEPDDLCDCLREFLNTRKQIKSRYLSSDIMCFWKALVFGQRFQRFYAAFQSPSARVLKECWLLLCLAWQNLLSEAFAVLSCRSAVRSVYLPWSLLAVAAAQRRHHYHSLGKSQGSPARTTGTTATRSREEHVLSWFETDQIVKKAFFLNMKL